MVRCGSRDTGLCCAHAQQGYHQPIDVYADYALCLKEANVCPHPCSCTVSWGNAHGAFTSMLSLIQIK